MLTPLLLAAPALLVAPAPPQSPPAGPPAGRRFADRELRPLADSLAAYFRAAEAAGGVEEARAELERRLAELAEELDREDPLSLSADLGRALWLAGGERGKGSKPGNVRSEEIAQGSFAGGSLEIAYRLPRAYDGTRAWPLVLAVPDHGEEPVRHLRTRWTERAILDGAILVSPAMPDSQEEWDRVVVNGRPGGLCHVLTALRVAGERFTIDDDRVFVVGFGKGVPAAVAAGNFAPQRFAGVAGRAGDTGDQGPENFENLPTYFSGAGARAEEFRRAAAELAVASCTFAPSGSELDLWNWVLANPRRAWPERVTLVVGQPFPTRAHWLRVAPTASDARATATVDRDANTVEIVSSGVSTATLYLSDALVDLDRPVRVLISHEEGNQEVRTLDAPRSLGTFLDLVRDGTSDPRCAYVAEVSVDARPAPTGGEADDAMAASAPDPDPRAALLAEAAERRAARHPDGVPPPRLGLELDTETGLWLDARDRRRLERGWVRQDRAWIPPDDAERVEAGLWLVDGEWLELEDANRRHARFERPWVIPTPEVLLHSTADRGTALRAAVEMGRALPDLERVFGAVPPVPLRVVVARDEEQYDRFAFGAPDGRRPPAHAGRLHVIHNAFFAESWFERAEGDLEHRGAGVCIWDPLVPHGDLYGVHSARLAMGLAYADAVDPSPKAVRKALRADGPYPGSFDDYEAEKRLPAWLRWGGAVYAERYFRDTRVADGGDPWWTREWSLENLERRGGLRELDLVLAFRLDPEDRDDGLKLLIEAGLLVAFLLDGDCAPAREAHESLRSAVAAGRLRPSHVAALE